MKIQWERLYRILEKITPLHADCGKLCGKKCCSVREGAGIYLFPGEEKNFSGDEQWCSLSECAGGNDYYTGTGGFILNCRGKCPREKRPLACRLFPLAPHLDGAGNLEIVMDSDALFICPLVTDGNINRLEASFLEGARIVWAELFKNASIMEGVMAYSARIDRQAREPWLRLLGK